VASGHIKPQLVDKNERLFYSVGVDALIKLSEIAVNMDLEPAEETPAAGQLPHSAQAQVAPCGQVVGRPPARSWPKPDKAASLGVTRVALPNGRAMPLLKTMLTTACERDCHYCPFRAGRNYRRTTFKPEEMARTFMDMHRAGAVEGLFLSSGIIRGGARTQDRLLDTIAILREKHRFRGYVHLKIMPGAERDQVYRAMQLADRLSVNLESPTPERLSLLAPKKRFVDELLAPLQWIEALRRDRPPGENRKGRWPSTVTQFVVGAVEETDLELLNATRYLVEQTRLRRVYYSRFKPVTDTPLENHPAENPWREHRLYQASFLFRDYGFDLEDMPFDERGRLPLDTDPKTAWAMTHLRDAPVEVNRADREALLRVPGVGPRGAEAILSARRRATLRSVDDLRRIGVRTKGIEPYVLLDGRRPVYQMRLFASDE
jgi:predicted DNA-binding helix-hairpin-helix protein